MKDMLPPFKRVDDACPYKQLCTDMNACSDAMLLLGDVEYAKKRVSSSDVALILQHRIDLYSCPHPQAVVAREAAQNEKAKHLSGLEGSEPKDPDI